MFLSLSLVVHVLSTTTVETSRTYNESGLSKLIPFIIHANDNFYKELLNGIRRERYYDSILLIRQSNLENVRLEYLHKINVPKIIITQSQIVNYKKYFNSEILAILVVDSNWHKEWLETLSYTLNFMRHTRVLVIIFKAENSSNSFIEVLLSSCKQFQMTNVLVHISNSKAATVEEGYYTLNPYPKYQLHPLNVNTLNVIFYPINWRNMRNITIKTLPDQYVMFSLTYWDEKGQIKFNGIASRLVLLFAETFNATLEMAYPVKPGEFIHSRQFVNLTQQGVVDIPMSLFVGFRPGIWTRVAYPFEFGKWMVVVPNSKRLKPHEILGIIVSKSVLGLLLLFIILFSVLHFAGDYIAEGRILLINLLLNDNVIRGILGQSFVLKLSSLISFKIIYFLIFLLGLNFNTGFSAYLNHLMTSAPFHKQIDTFEDLRSSNVKILFDNHDLANETTELLKPMGGSMEFTWNTSYYLEQRMSLNDSYGYTTATLLWDLLVQQQTYFGQRVFRSPKDLTICDSTLSIILAEDSQFKEPMDYLIQRVHEVGLRSAWVASTFLDMIKHRKVIAIKPAPPTMCRGLKDYDLWWAWCILLGGLLSSAVIFLVELLVAYYLKRGS